MLVLAVSTYASMKFCDLGFEWARGLEFKPRMDAKYITFPFSHMANLTPWLSTLRCIVPVASSGQILSQYVLVLASMQTPCSHLLRVTHECIVCSLRSSFLNVGMQTDMLERS